LGTVELEALSEPADIEEVHTLVSKHAELTGSTVAKDLLKDWKSSVQKFVKVMPTDYKRVLLEQAKEAAAKPAVAKA
jgi:glutamate synthase domain-containing protein 3